MGDPYTFGDWVRRRRKALDLTQEALAERIGCALDTIRKIESGARRPSRQIAERLADQLELPEDLHMTFLHAARSDQAVTHLVSPVPVPVSPLIRTVHSQIAGQPSGTLTFLGTDIEGSTQLWERHPITMPAALARHDALLQHTISAHRGVVFKTTGAGVYAAFARAGDALTAAIAAQQVLLEEAWGETDPLKVRMVLHTGVAEERDGDYIGPPLNRAARLLGVGYGGQILLSRATQELVCDQLPSDVVLHDLGTHRLKDLIRPEHIFQVNAPSLPASFSPLRTLDSHQHNLPAQMTPLIGRTTEIAAVCNLLRHANVRLLTLTGPGGTGKTRLALQAAAEMLGDFADGVYVVNLAPISDPTLVVAAIAQTLDVKEIGDQPLVERLKAYLKPKKQLLVLDNFEQILESGSLVVDLLAAAPDVKVLVTSRAVLHVYGEHEYTVPPLAVPDPSRLPDKGVISQYDAVRLFIEQARAVKADFRITNANAPAVAEICYRLDGLPLAIELAAARSKLFAPEALLVRLSNRLQLLTGGARTLPLRQQTLRNTIDWSYDLLDIYEQVLFTRLSVFVGGCTLSAVEAVCNADGDLKIDILDGLTSLIDKSLLQQEDDPGDELRFNMLETIREYASERLEKRGENDTIQRNQAAFFVTLAEEADPKIHGPEKEIWLHRLEIEHNNMRAAFQWALDHKEMEITLRMAAAIWGFWYMHSYYSEGRRWLEATLTAYSSGVDHSAWIEVITGAAMLSREQGDHRRATALFEESLALHTSSGNKQGIGFALNSLGIIATFQGDFAHATALHEESLALRRERGNKKGIAYSLNNLACVALAQGNYVQALRLAEESLALQREVRNEWGVAVALNTLAFSMLGQGNHRHAAAAFTEGLALFRQMGHKAGIAESFVGLIGVMAEQKQFAYAARLRGATETLLITIGIVLDPHAQFFYDTNTASVRAQVADILFYTAVLEGRKMPLDQIFEEMQELLM